MARASKEQCEDKRDQYETAKSEYEAYRDDVEVYHASFELKVEQLENEDIPAKETKVKERLNKMSEIRDLLGGANAEDARSASGRVEEIDARLKEINDRLNEIMRSLDGEAEPTEVPLLFSEGDTLAQERESLLSERESLVTLIANYNAVIDQVSALESEVQALQQEIEQMQANIDALEAEAEADKNYVETAQGKADTRKYAMEKLLDQWEDYGCSSYFGELPAFEEAELLDVDDFPEDEESPVDTGDYEIPESIDDPGEPEEGEEWNPDDYENATDTG